MKDDPTIEKIREVRHKISEQHQHDPEQVIRYYMQLQQRYKDRFLHPAKAIPPERRLQREN